MAPSRRVTGRCTCSVALLSSILAGSQVYSQVANNVPAGRPTIGLVLEGGGALGLAHIGVLRWLEENRIPVDMVAGTSMGSLIGGLYASGMSPDQIEHVARTTEWDTILELQVPFQDLSFRRKEDRRAFPAAFEFGLKKGLNVPSGLNNGFRVELLLDRNLVNYSTVRNFDDLPIPFRCVATDLVSGKPVVFKSGVLSEAMRASMSLPAVFKPISRNKQVLADGGLLNNLPVDVAKDMGADIVIAVFLETGPFDPTDSASLFGSLGRAVSVMITANELRNMELADIMITADLTGFTTSDYRRNEQIMPRGYEGAERKRRILSRFALSQEQWAAHRAAFAARIIRQSPVPTEVRVAGAGDEHGRHIADLVRKHATQDGLDIAGLERDVIQTTGNGFFSNFTYNLETRADGKTELVVHAKEKQPSYPILTPGIEIEGTELNNFNFALTGRVLWLNFLDEKQELRFDYSLGNRNRLFTELFRRFGTTSRWFLAPRAFASQAQASVTRENVQIARYNFAREGGAFDVGYSIDRNSEFRFGYEIGNERASVRIGDPALARIDGRYGLTYARYAYDSFDNPYVPRSGLLVYSRMGWQDAAAAAPGAFPLMETSARYFKPVSRKYSLWGSMSAGTTFNSANAGGLGFTLGGPFRLGAYSRDELRGYDYWYASGGFLREIGQLSPLVGGRISAGLWYETGRTYGSPLSTRDLAQSVSGGVIARTILGPVLLGLSFGDNSRRQWYLQIGRIF